MTYGPDQVANNVLALSFSERRLITPMKLQKILYFTASEYSKRTGLPLFDEPFGTWRYGPVLTSIYREFRIFSRTDIRKYARDAGGEALMVNPEVDRTLTECIETVWEATKPLSSTRLSELTHLKGSAWSKAVERKDPYLSNEDILNDQTYREPLGLPS